MRQVIYKYPILSKSHQVTQIPRGASQLHFALQDNCPCMWLQVCPDEPKEKWQIITHGTGHEVGAMELYVGTYQEGPYVWHVYKKLID